jgi:hypothetical protein
MEDSKLKINIENVLKSKIKQNTNQKKDISNFVKSENDNIEKKCKTCNESIKKLTPYLVFSGIIFIFFVYGVISSISHLINLFTQ